MRDMSSCHLAVFTAAAVAVLAFTSTAWAERESEAEKRFREGRSAFESKDFATACPKFVQSQKLDPQPGTLLNLGICEERRGNLVAATDALRKVTEQLPANDERVAIAREHLIAVEARFPRLTVKLSPNAPAGTRVARDGVEMPSAAFGQAQPVEPGERVLVVTAPGHAAQTFSVKLDENQEKELVVEPGPGEGPASTTTRPGGDGSAAGMGASSGPTSSGGPRSSSRTLGYVLGGAGLVGIGVGTVFGMMTLGDVSDAKDDPELCPNKVCSEAGRDKVDSAATKGWVSTIALGAGAAALGVGLVLVLTSPSTAEEPTRTGVLHVAPLVGATAGGLAVDGRF